MHLPVAGSNSEGVFFLVGTYFGEGLNSTFYDYEYNECQTTGS